MGRNRVTIGPPQLEDFARLPAWFERAGVASDDPAAEATRFERAFTGGYLGVATGGGFRHNLEQLTQLPDNQWGLARMMVRVLRLNDAPIGALIMGAHRRLWDVMHSRMGAEAPGDGEPSLDLTNFMIAALSVAKIHTIVVDPEQQGRGHGTRLLRSALDTAIRDKLIMVYGQFAAERTPLVSFYERAGFAVLDPGEPLSLAMITGNGADAMTGLASDRFFVREQRPTGD